MKADQDLATAIAARDAREAAGEDATIKIAEKLLFNQARQASPIIALLARRRREGGQLAAMN